MRALAKLYRFTRPTPRERGLFLAAAGASLFLAADGALAALLSRVVYDHSLQSGAEASLYAILGVAVFLAVLDLVLRVCRARWMDAAGEDADSRMGAETFARVLYDRTADVPASHVASALHGSHETVRSALGSTVALGAVDAVSALVCVLLAAVVAGPLALVPLLFGGSVPVVCWIAQARAARGNTAAATHRQRLVQEAVAGIEDVKACRAEGLLVERMAAVCRLTAETSTSMRDPMTFATAWTSFASGGTQTLVLVLGAMMVLDGSLSSGALIAVTLLSGRAVGPLVSLSGSIAQVARALESLSILEPVLRIAPEDDGGRLALSPAEIGSDIALEDVRFTYKGGKLAALRGLTLAVPAGQVVALIGRRGCGKSTTGRLLAGLHGLDGDGCGGLVTLGGRSVAQIAPRALRAAVGLATQDPVLFSGTLLDNVRLANPGASDDDVARALRDAGADGTARLPDGLGTRIIEGGRNLSGGERQSVAPARILLADTKVLFLDEPTAHLDLATRDDLMAAVLWRARERGVTVMIATHDVGVLPHVDRVVRLENGRALVDMTRDAAIALARQGRLFAPVEVLRANRAAPAPAAIA